VPDRDYFSCAEAEIAEITGDLTVVGGNIDGAKKQEHRETASLE
jgi:hypothetical protein